MTMKKILISEEMKQAFEAAGYERELGNTDMKYIRLYLEENYDLTSEKKIMDAADLAAHQNSYHPVR